MIKTTWTTTRGILKIRILGRGKPLCIKYNVKVYSTSSPDHLSINQISVMCLCVSVRSDQRGCVSGTNIGATRGRPPTAEGTLRRRERRGLLRGTTSTHPHRWGAACGQLHLLAAVVERLTGKVASFGAAISFAEWWSGPTCARRPAWSTRDALRTAASPGAEGRSSGQSRSRAAPTLCGESCSATRRAAARGRTGRRPAAAAPRRSLASAPLLQTPRTFPRRQSSLPRCRRPSITILKWTHEYEKWTRVRVSYNFCSVAPHGPTGPQSKFSRAAY